MERVYVVKETSRSFDGRTGRVTLRGVVEVTTPDRDPTVLTLTIEAPLKQTPPNERAHDGALLLELLADRFQRPLPRKSAT